MSDHSAAGGPPLSSHDENADEVVQSHPDAWISAYSVPYDESVVHHLFDSETQQGNHRIRHLDSLRHLASRQDSINWILKVHAHYHFNPVTALLSVGYFDRFLSSYSLPASGWAYQLLSVACLALATKMEEQYVPLLLDLQIMEPTCMFDPKTVQRMELLVMACLNWKLRLVTPFDFLRYFISRTPSPPPPPVPYIQIASTFSNLVVNTIRVVDFLRFPPSVIAAAAVILATGNSVELPDTFYERANKELVRSCHQLMEEYLVDTCPSADPKVRSYVETLLAAPPSPVGVLDSAACASCDTRSDNPPCLVSGSGAGQRQQLDPEFKPLRSSVGNYQQGQR